MARDAKFLVVGIKTRRATASVGGGQEGVVYGAFRSLTHAKSYELDLDLWVEKCHPSPSPYVIIRIALRIERAGGPSWLGIAGPLDTYRLLDQLTLNFAPYEFSLRPAGGRGATFVLKAL